MEDIVKAVRANDTIQVRAWMDNTENDLNQGDEHRFTLLHWACREGCLSVVDQLLQRGAKAHLTNMGDDTPLHLAAAHNRLDCVITLLRMNAQRQLPQMLDVNAGNEHGNTPLHYACFWQFTEVAKALIQMGGALVTMENRAGQTPLDKVRSPQLKQELAQLASQYGQAAHERHTCRDSSWDGTRVRAKDVSTLSRWDYSTVGGTLSWTGTQSGANVGIPIDQIQFVGEYPLLPPHLGGGVWGEYANRAKEVRRAKYAGLDVVVKMLKLPQYTVRNSRDFAEEVSRLRIFNHANIAPVIATVNQFEQKRLWLLSHFSPNGSLFDVLHGGNETVLVDVHQACRFALNICAAMHFLHSQELKVSTYSLNSKHVLVDEDLVAKLDMSDCKFSFVEKLQEYNPAWLSPEALTKAPSEINQQAAHMWSFGVILWELETREVPFHQLTNAMDIGLKVATTSLRLPVGQQPGCSRQMSRLIALCLNDEPGKRPRFDMVQPILQKMLEAAARALQQQQQQMSPTMENGVSTNGRMVQGTA